MSNRESIILNYGSFVNRPSYYAKKYWPGNLEIDDQGWSTDEEQYWDLHSSSASIWVRAVKILVTSRYLLIKPGYHGGTSFNDGKCNRKGSSNISRSQWPAIIPYRMDRRIAFHRCSDRDRLCFLCLQNSLRYES